MAKLQEFRQMSAEYSEVADFVLVYIDEAHPTDGWKIAGSLFELPSHKTLEDRASAAQMMLKEEPQGCPVVLDNMENLANSAYAALPERLYIVLDGIVVYKGGMGPWLYKLGEVESWLKDFKEKNSNKE